MKADNDTLYIFFHLPKCAGTTLRHHIEKNFPSDEILGFYNSQKRKLSKDNVYDIVESMGEQERERIRIVYGHEVHYGIHKVFSRPAKYFTFLRNPVAKTISFYNYRMQRGIYDYRKQKGIRRTEIDESQMPSFEEWLHNSPGMHDGMLGDFMRYGYGRSGAIDEHSLRAILKKFYFIGITERYDEDGLFIYKQLGIRRFYENRNRSKKYFATEDLEKTRSLILSKTMNDHRLYEYALEANNQFKEQTPDFYRIVRSTKIKRYLWRHGGRLFVR